MHEAALSYGSAATSAPQPKAAADLAAPHLAEFIGTFVLVATVGCCALSPGDPTFSPTSIGFIAMVMIYGTGPSSGGNLNPAVSFSLGLIGHLKWTVVLRYILVQAVAAIAAGSCFSLLFEKTKPVEPVWPFTWGYAAISEVIYTFLVCFVANNCIASKRNNPKDDGNQFYGLAIGFSVIAGGYAAGGISGGFFNPAVFLGMAISGGGFKQWALTYIVAELLGATLAAIMFWVLRPEEYNLPDGGLADWEPRLHVRCASEFLGTSILVLTVGLSMTMESGAVAFAAASALMVMIYALGNVSGGHFNPAVTLGVVLSGRDKCSVSDGAAYVICQVLGATCAGLLYAQFHAAGPHRDRTYGLAPRDGYGPSAAGVAELVFTFVLAYVVLVCATVSPPSTVRTKHNFFFALAIGSCVTVGGFAAEGISGGALNPALSVGIATASITHHGWTTPPQFVDCFIYALWELTGGLLAAVLFRLTHPDEYKKAPLLAK